MTKSLVRKNQVLKVEEKEVKPMMMADREDARVLTELSWFEFRKQLQYKADWYGREYVSD